MTVQYVLRNLPTDLWVRFSNRATSENWTLRALFLQLMDDYGNHHISPTKSPPRQRSEWAWLRPHFRKLARYEPFLNSSAFQQWQGLARAVASERPEYVQLLSALSV